MNAPKTRDPLAVTTRDGMSWVRRAVTQDGRGLYAPEGVCSCPEFVMATLVELAEHGIKGRDPVADAVAVMGALPVPVGPDKPAVDKTHALIVAAIGEAKPVRDGVLVSLAQSVKDRAEHDHSGTADWDWYCLNLSGYMGDRMGPVLRRLVDAESERDALRARVAELEPAVDEALPYTEGRAAFMQIGHTPSLQGLRVELHIDGFPPLVGRYAGAGMRTVDGVLLIEPMLMFERDVTRDVEALHASSGAVIEVPARPRAAVENLHETPPRPRPTPHDLPEVTP